MSVVGETGRSNGDVGFGGELRARAARWWPTYGAVELSRKRKGRGGRLTGGARRRCQGIFPKFRIKIRNSFNFQKFKRNTFQIQKNSNKMWLESLRLVEFKYEHTLIENATDKIW